MFSVPWPMPWLSGSTFNLFLLVPGQHQPPELASPPAPMHQGRCAGVLNFPGNSS